MKHRLTHHLMAALLGVVFTSKIHAQTSAFTYQGRLSNNGQPASGSYDLVFSLHDAETGGSQVGSFVTNSSVVVSDGLFTVTLDFGSSAFTGADRWLEVAARASGGGAFVPLNPRQAIAAAPYALYAPAAGEASSATTATSASSVSAGAVDSAAIQTGAVDSAKIQNGTITEVDLSVALAGATFWRLGGNTGTTAGANFVGTTDNQPLEIRVNGQRALRFEDNGDGSDTGTIPDGAPNVIGGSPGNFVGAGVVGATIAGGGATEYGGSARTNVGLADYVTVGGGADNRVKESVGATIAGGFANRIDEDSYRASIGGGNGNHIGEGSDDAVIAGGRGNTISDFARGSSVAGGSFNSIRTASSQSAIGGGYANVINLDADSGMIGGGRGNLLDSDASYSGIAGGLSNNVGSTHAFIGGGRDNLIEGGASSATIAGGSGNDIARRASSSAIGGGSGNGVNSDSGSATIAGGSRNEIGSSAEYGAIGGGSSNLIGNLTVCTTIAGGFQNEVGSSSYGGAMGGGVANQIADSVWIGTIAGGYRNRLDPVTDNGVIGGGYANRLAADSWSATIAGGANNATGTNSAYSAMGGGRDNGITANGRYATIPGGYLNAATNHAFAAGNRAKANHSGAFVWADYQNADFVSITNNEFAVRASGGARLVGSATLGSLLVAPDEAGGADDSQVMLGEERNGVYGMIVRYDGGDNQLQVLGKAASGTSGPHVVITRDSGNVGVKRAPTANDLEVEGTASKTTAGSWLANSDARIKEDVRPVADALERLNRVRLVSFRYTDDYREEHPAVEDRRYLNVVAQEFAQVFPDEVQGSGETLPDGSEILQVDTYPLTIYAAAAVQELNRRVESGRQNAENRLDGLEVRNQTAEVRIQQLEAENAGLKSRLDRLERLLAQRGAGAL